MNSKPALIVGYLVSGTTAASGAATDHGHIVLGLPIGEIALVIGIIGTLSTITLQILSYVNARKARIESSQFRVSGHNDHNVEKPVEEKE